MMPSAAGSITSPMPVNVSDTFLSTTSIRAWAAAAAIQRVHTPTRVNTLDTRKQEHLTTPCVPPAFASTSRSSTPWPTPHTLAPAGLRCAGPTVSRLHYIPQHATRPLVPGCSSSLTSRRSNSVNASAVAPANPAMTPSPSLRTWSPQPPRSVRARSYDVWEHINAKDRHAHLGGVGLEHLRALGYLAVTHYRHLAILPDRQDGGAVDGLPIRRTLCLHCMNAHSHTLGGETR